VTYGAIRFLDAHVGRETRVFEFGCGGSTIFFARRAASVVSVEHDAAWAQRVERSIAAKGWTNSDVRVVDLVRADHMVDCDPADPALYATGDEVYRSCSFKDYASAIDEFPDGHFDAVLIDGRARPSCAKHAARKVMTGGLLILDNAERSYYTSVHEQLSADRWLRRSFYGPGPCSPNFWLTVIWQKLA
jgi:predicted O-methyltransferase YrrM